MRIGTYAIQNFDTRFPIFAIQTRDEIPPTFVRQDLGQDLNRFCPVGRGGRLDQALLVIFRHGFSESERDARKELPRAFCPRLEPAPLATPARRVTSEPSEITGALQDARLVLYKLIVCTRNCDRQGISQFEAFGAQTHPTSGWWD